MLAKIKALWDRLLGRVPDTRPDPEDVPAYVHADDVQAKQSARAFPLQSLRGGKRPSDVAEGKDWGDAPGMESWVDVYEGPQGIGYVINYEVARGPKTFHKAVNYGPETYREKDWTEVPEEIRIGR